MVATVPGYTLARQELPLHRLLHSWLWWRIKNAEEIFDEVDEPGAHSCPQIHFFSCQTKISNSRSCRRSRSVEAWQVQILDEILTWNIFFSSCRNILSLNCVYRIYDGERKKVVWISSSKWVQHLLGSLHLVHLQTAGGDQAGEAAQSVRPGEHHERVLWVPS